MEPIERWRDGVSWFVAAVSVGASYEIRDAGLIEIPETGLIWIDKVAPGILALIILLLSLSVARKFAGWLVSKGYFRAWILGEDYIDGYWHLKTESGEPTSPISPDGVLWVRYEANSSRYAATTTRLRESGESYAVPSKLVQLRREGNLLLYVNYFVISDDGSQAKEGVSKGYFMKTEESAKTKDRFDAYIFSEDENSRHQWAIPIRKDLIRQCRQEADDPSPQGWMAVYLSRYANRDKR